MIATGLVRARPADFGWFEEHLIALFDAAPDFGVAATLLAVAGGLAVGVAHAVGPGHGKAVVVGYLAGGQGRPRDAVALGAVVSLMHTGSVLAVGFALFAATRAVDAGQLTFVDDAGAWLRIVAGSLVVAVGAGMLVRERRRSAVGVPIGGPAGGSPGSSGHAEGPSSGHSHGLERLPTDVSPLSRQGVLLIGASGGLLPSPAAFLVVATGLFTGNLALALALVGAFSLGLAVTICAVGLAAIWGRDRLVERMERHGTAHRVGRWVPRAAAALILVAGTLTAAVGVARLL